MDACGLANAGTRGEWRSGTAGCCYHTRGAEEKKKTDVPTYLPFLRFFEIFRSDLRKYFMVFLGSSCRETAKNAIKKIDGKRRKEKSFFSSTFSAKSF
jgi:hypothetical protein